MTHAINDADGRAGRRHAVARNLEYLSQVQSTLALFAEAGGARPAVGGRRARGEESAERDDDSPRAAAAEDSRRRPRGAARAARPRRAGDGAAVARRRPTPTRSSTSTSSPDEIRRLDEVVQGFLKFTRPEDLGCSRSRWRRCSTRSCRSSQPEARAQRRAARQSSATGVRRRSTATRRCCGRRS